jgi:hypothetical protein
MSDQAPKNFDIGDLLNGPAPWQEPDTILSYLISTLVNGTGVPLGVTLFVNGTVISGVLVSEREYLLTLTQMVQAQARQMLGDLPEEELQMAESAFDFTDLTEDIYPEDVDDFDHMEMIHTLTYLHLKDPIIVSPQPSVSFGDGTFPLLRLRLSLVSGWMLGMSIPGSITFTSTSSGDIRH